MNLSRAAKRLRAELPPQPKAPKPVMEMKTKAPPPAPEPEPVAEVVAPVEVVAEEVVAPAVEPIAEPIAVVEPQEPAPPPPKKEWPAKAQRPRFVRVETEKRARGVALTLPQRSTKLASRMLTQNLALPPKEDDPKFPR